MIAAYDFAASKLYRLHISQIPTVEAPEMSGSNIPVAPPPAQMKLIWDNSRRLDHKLWVTEIQVSSILFGDTVVPVTE